MRGFDDKALILFPAYEHWESKNATFKYSIVKSVNHLCTYLDSVGITPYAFYTDDIARKINPPAFKWINPVGKADLFFMSTYCDNCADAMTRPMLEYPEIVQKVIAKDPGSVDMTTENRFEMVNRHVKKALSVIIPQYKIVFHFALKNRSQYKVTTKEGDCKIRVNIDYATTTPTVYLSGKVEDAVDILGVPYANRSLENWPLD